MKSNTCLEAFIIFCSSCLIHVTKAILTETSPAQGIHKLMEKNILNWGAWCIFEWVFGFLGNRSVLFSSMQDIIDWWMGITANMWLFSPNLSIFFFSLSHLTQIHLDCWVILLWHESDTWYSQAKLLSFPIWRLYRTFWEKEAGVNV